MPDIAHKRTDDMIEELEKKISSEYNRAAKEVEGKMRAYLAKTEREAEKQRELLKAGKITKKDYTDWMTRKYAMGARWEELRDNLAGDMANANKIARSISNGYRADAYALNHNFAMYQAEHDGKCSTVYQLYDRQTVERLIEKDRDLMPPPGRKLAEQIRTGKVEKWNHQQLQSALTQSILQGEGIAETARRVARTVATRGYNDSVRYARTMMTGAENAGRNDGFKTAEDLGINLEKEWVATLDDRTRATHALLHGERAPVDGIFSNGLEYPGDPAGADEEVWNCRCTMKASVKGFEHDRVESSPKMGDMTFDEWQESRGVWSGDLTDFEIPEEKPLFSLAKPFAMDDLEVRREPQFAFPNGQFGGVRKTAPAVIYKTPDGVEFVFPAGYNKRQQTLTPQQLLEAYNRVPAEVRVRGQKQIIIHDVYNPQDTYWRKRYAGFTHSYMTGGKEISVWRQDDAHDDQFLTYSLCHEMGHWIDREQGNAMRSPLSSRSGWKEAMDADFTFGGRRSPTRYGENANTEDFAESIAKLYEDPDGLKEKFPHRYAFLVELFTGG